MLALSSGQTAVGKGRGYMDFVTDALLLVGGAYYVNSSITAEGRTLDAVHRAAEMTIRAAGVTSGGTYVQKGEWVHLPIDGLGAR